MILYQSSTILLDYTPATDILEVVYPDLRAAQLDEVKHSLMQLVEAIHNYDVKKLLLDGSRSAMEVTEEESQQMAMQLAAELAKTRLKKVARIRPSDSEREISSQDRINQIKHAGLLPYEVKTFTSRAEANAWLKSDFPF
ncbi:hypothetical protein ACSX1A_11105 [Pontibacter sp. MBLB2868]|uniref:hypothetical protein n=1 Tax=Pontibacter sp. MBLB2868 TaxID=3451555 RepID=UPI003F75264C